MIDIGSKVGAGCFRSSPISKTSKNSRAFGAVQHAAGGIYLGFKMLQNHRNGSLLIVFSAAGKFFVILSHDFALVGL